MTPTQKEYKKYSDLYGFENTFLKALKDFDFVSFCPKSIPVAGTLGYSTSKIKTVKVQCEILDIICHKDEGITIKTDKGNHRFWKH